MPRSRVRRKRVVAGAPPTPSAMKSGIDRILRALDLRDAGPAFPPLARPGVTHALAAALTVAVYSILHSIIVWPLFSVPDYAGHVLNGEAFYRTGHLTQPHFLYHALIAGLYATRLVPSFLLAGRLVVMASYPLTALLVYAALYAALHRDARLGRPAALLVAALATLEAQPIGARGGIGFLWNEPYNIPTFTLLKPFALAGFLLTARLMSGRRRPDWRLLAPLAAVTVAGALIKPSYLICLLPAAAILMPARRIFGRPLSRGALLAALVAPAVAVLLWQYLQSYGGTPGVVEYRDRILWAPLRVMRHWASGLELKFLASVAFPAAVLLFHFGRALRDAWMQLAWLTFVCGALYAYLLSEDIRWTHGNFLWSAYSSLFVLFVASAVFWLRGMAEAGPRGWRWAGELVCLGALLAHAISGAVLARTYVLAALQRP